jgi:hypothetical protein
MRPFPAREVAAALTRKGFAKRENDHTHYHFILKKQRVIPPDTDD